MATRTKLSTTPALTAAAMAKEGATVDSTEIKTTSVSFPSWAISLLIGVSASRKIKRVHGVQSAATVSAILLELIEKNRAELEAEIQ